MPLDHHVEPGAAGLAVSGCSSCDRGERTSELGGERGRQVLHVADAAIARFDVIAHHCLAAAAAIVPKVAHFVPRDRPVRVDVGIAFTSSFVIETGSTFPVQSG